MNIVPFPSSGCGLRLARARFSFSSFRRVRSVVPVCASVCAHVCTNYSSTIHIHSASFPKRNQRHAMYTLSFGGWCFFGCTPHRTLWPWLCRGAHRFHPSRPTMAAAASQFARKRPCLFSCIYGDDSGFFVFVRVVFSALFSTVISCVCALALSRHFRSISLHVYVYFAVFPRHSCGPALYRRHSCCRCHPFRWCFVVLPARQKLLFAMFASMHASMFPN